MSFDKCMMLHNHHHNQDVEEFCHTPPGSRKFLHAASLLSTPPRTSRSSNHKSVEVVLFYLFFSSLFIHAITIYFENYVLGFEVWGLNGQQD